MCPCSPVPCGILDEFYWPGRTKSDHEIAHIEAEITLKPLVKKHKGDQLRFSLDIIRYYIQNYYIIPLWSSGSKDLQNTDTVAFEVKEPGSAVHVSPSSCDKTKKHDDKTKREANGNSPVELSTRVRDLRDEFEEFSNNSSNGVNVASTPVTAIGPNSTNSTNTFSAAGPSNNVVSLNFDLGGKSSFVD
nr:hypothetical protein [Tanacetum cinerariifolium]